MSAELPQTVPSVNGIITCSDGRMLAAACCALLSAKRNLRSATARFFLLAIDVDAAGVAAIEAFGRTHDLPIEILTFVTPSFEGQSFGRWPSSAVARLYMDSYVPSEILRLLYLDADVVVAAPLDALFTMDMQGHMIGAVDDYLMAFPAKIGRRMAQIGMRPDGRYFNSGVLLIDWSRMAEHNIIKQARDVFAADSNRYDCPDQDALNVVADAGWLVLDPRWNAQTGILPFVGPPGVIHFTGKKKPWHQRSQWPHLQMKAFYHDALTNSPWSGFCAPGSTVSSVRAFLSYYLTAMTKHKKIAATRAYFTKS